MNLLLSRGTHRSKSAPVKTAGESDDLIARRTVRPGLGDTIFARQLDHALIGFGSAVGKEALAGNAHDIFHQNLRQLRLLTDAVPVRNMNQRVRLA